VTNPQDANLAQNVVQSRQSLNVERMQITSPDLRKELAQVRSGTAKYHNVADARDAGYVRISGFVPGMGYHFQREDLVDDGTIDKSTPEVLVYAPQPKEGTYKLVAVEYLVIKPEDDSTPPEVGFTGDRDHWHVLPAAESGAPVDFWALHAWVWEHNPKGMFHETNPRIGLTPEE